MNSLRQLLRRPRQLWIRRASFQIHLWAGIVLALYAIVIGVTGAILVFGAELEAMEKPSPWPKLAANSPIADVAVVMDRLQGAFPGAHFVSIMTPTPAEPIFIATLATPRRIQVACHPVTGAVLKEIRRTSSRFDWIYDLHENLFARRTGRVINGFAAFFVILLALTGLFNWWPGVKHWRRAMSIDFRRTWKRVNFDLHSAVGFWTLGLLVIWASSGIYFVWPGEFIAFIDRVSPILNSRPPAVTVQAEQEAVQLDFHALLQKARAVDPGTDWTGVFFPASRRSPIEFLMAQPRSEVRDYQDTVYFNPYTGVYISTWEYGVKKSLGDWIIWLQVPLHFGTHWGFLFKCLWAFLGLAMPVLAVSGLLMYWNRFLSKKWNRLRTANQSSSLS